MASIYRTLALRPLPLLRVAAPPRTPARALPIRLLSALASSQTTPSATSAAAAATQTAGPETPLLSQVADGQVPDAPRKKSRKRSTKIRIHPPSTKVKQRGPYFEARNFANNLAVYQRRKRGGNMLVTEIKKVQGDARKLDDEKHEKKEQTKDEDKDNPRTNHVVLKVRFCLCGAP